MAALPDVDVHPVNPAQPVALLATANYTAPDLVADVARPSTVVTLIPAGEETRRVRYIVDYAAHTDNAEPSNAGDVVANFKIHACLPGTERCRNLRRCWCSSIGQGNRWLGQ